MAEDYDKSRAEDCRHDVLHHLATVSTTARDVPAIRRSINRNSDYTEREVSAACYFLLGLGYLTRRDDPLGSTVYYQISAAGQLADERGLA